MAAPIEPLAIQSVLVPLDGGVFAEQALPWATAIARKARARLRLALVHTLPFPPPLDAATKRHYLKVELAARKAERDYLRRTAARVRGTASLRMATALLEGTPAAALARHVSEVGPDLLVMTTHGRGGIERAWLGSVADQLVRTLQIPMLLVRPRPVEPPTELTRMLVPLDGSRRSEAILPAAVGLASLFDAGLSLLQIVYPVTTMTDPAISFPTGFDEELTALERGRAQDYLDGLVGRLAEAGVQASGAAVVGGSAYTTIQAAAHDQEADMVALTTHGRGGVRRMVLGSIADKLVRAGEFPVLVGRPHGE